MGPAETKGSSSISAVTSCRMRRSCRLAATSPNMGQRAFSGALDLARATDKMAAFVATLARENEASDVIGLGFSNGANILANLLIEKDLFDKAILLHPLIPFKPKDNAGLEARKILITAGQRDPICPAPLTQALADYFKAQKADVDVEWHTGGHDIRPNEIEAIKRFLG
jgi:phospholipase/carboxylesterase